MAELERLIDEKAAWATQFGNATTNLSQRIRYAEDRARGDEMIRARRDAAGEELLRRDKGARELYFGRERARQADERLDLSRRQFESGERRFEATQDRLLDKDAFDQEMRLRTDDLRQAQELRMRQKADFDTRNAKRITEQSSAAEREAQELLEFGLRPGSEGFAAGALSLIAKYPYMEKSVRDSLVASAKIAQDPETLDSVLADMTPEQAKTAKLSRDAKGNWTASVSPQKPVDELGSLRKELDSVLSTRQSLQGMTDLDDDQKKSLRALYDQDITRLTGEIGRRTQPAAQPAASATPAKTDSRPVFRDKNGNRAYRNPDGSYEPIL